MDARLSILQVIQRSVSFLEEKGVENARLDAEHLIAAVLGLNRMALYLQFERPVSENELSAMRQHIARRGKREPLQYILGEMPFHGISLKCDRRALIPRPETEQLVELILERVGDSEEAQKILDLGTGTGAIALALASALSSSRVVAVDRSETALDLARENASHCGVAHRVTFRISDWFEAIKFEERFDLIVSNPPYLSKAELASAQPEVRAAEPVEALVSDEEGLADLRQIVTAARFHLAPGGQLWLETGIAHREPLLALCRENGYASTEGFDDWSKRPRFVLAKAEG